MSDKLGEQVMCNKLVIHLPESYLENGEVIDNSKNVNVFLSTLICGFDNLGYKSMYISPSEGVYDGHRYPQRLVVVYSYHVLDKLISYYKDLVNVNHNLLKQGSYSYESNDTLHVFRVSDE